MSDLIRRPNSRVSRRAREDRAYKLVMTGGAAALVAVVTALLAIVGVLGWGLPVVAALIAAICGVLFRRTVGG